MLYNPPSGSTDANAPYVGKNVAGGTQGSKVSPAAVEYPQREMVAMIAASGQSPTNNILVQGAIALGRGIWVDNLTGTGDLAVATLGVVLPSLLKGMRIGGVATATNTVTNPKLRVINLGSVGGATEFPILKEDGSALAIGDIKAGRRYRYEADGAGNVLISGGGIGGASGSAAAVFLPPQFLTTSGTYTVPANVSLISYVLTGAGGNGGPGTSGASGGGGGAGATAIGILSVTPGQSISYIIGQPSSAGPSGGQAGSGGSSSLGSVATAGGGTGGQGAGYSTAAGGFGGTASGAQVLVPGGDGNDGYINNGTTPSGLGGSGFWGGGGRAGVGISGTPGRPALAFGSGGGGAYAATGNGGNGAPGILIIKPLA